MGIKKGFQTFPRIGRSPKNILPELKTVLPKAVPRLRDIEGYVDPTEPLREEGPFGDPAGAGLLHFARAVSRLPSRTCGTITHRKDAVYPATIVPRLRDQIPRGVDDDVDVHNTSDVLFRLCANTDPQRDSLFTKGPSDVLDHATSEIASGSKLGIDATKKMPGKVSNAPGRRSSRWMQR